MLTLIRPVKTLYNTEKALKMVEELNSGDDDWTYKVEIVNPEKNYAVIHIIDEEGFDNGTF